MEVGQDGDRALLLAEEELKAVHVITLYLQTEVLRVLVVHHKLVTLRRAQMAVQLKPVEQLLLMVMFVVHLLILDVVAVQSDLVDVVLKLAEQ